MNKKNDTKDDIPPIVTPGSKTPRKFKTKIHEAQYLFMKRRREEREQRNAFRQAQARLRKEGTAKKKRQQLADQAKRNQVVVDVKQPTIMAAFCSQKTVVVDNTTNGVGNKSEGKENNADIEDVDKEEEEDPDKEKEEDEGEEEDANNDEDDEGEEDEDKDKGEEDNANNDEEEDDADEDNASDDEEEDDDEEDNDEAIYFDIGIGSPTRLPPPPAAPYYSPDISQRLNESGNLIAGAAAATPVNDPTELETKECNKCNNAGNASGQCHNRLYSSFCIHNVLDYYENDKRNDITNDDINSCFHSAYLLNLRSDILRKTKWYDQYTYQIPDCMMPALKYATDLINWKKCVSYIDGRRVYNVIGRETDGGVLGDNDDYIDGRYR